MTTNLPLLIIAVDRAGVIHGVGSSPTAALRDANRQYPNDRKFKRADLIYSEATQALVDRVGKAGGNIAWDLSNGVACLPS